MSADNDKIAQTAYRIWDEEGRPEGRDLDHWLRAQAMLTASPPKAAKPAKPKAVAAAKPKAVTSAKPKAAKA